MKRYYFLVILVVVSTWSCSNNISTNPSSNGIINTQKEKKFVTDCCDRKLSIEKVVSKVGLGAKGKLNGDLSMTYLLEPNRNLLDTCEYVIVYDSASTKIKFGFITCM